MSEYPLKSKYIWNVYDAASNQPVSTDISPVSSAESVSNSEPALFARITFFESPTMNLLTPLLKSSRKLLFHVRILDYRSRYELREHRNVNSERQRIFLRLYLALVNVYDI